MIDALAGWPARRPLHSVFILIIIVAGAVTATLRLPLERVPTPSSAALQVRAELPGIDLVAVDSLVTEPLVRALDAISGVQQLNTRSRDGGVVFELRFASSTERDSAIEPIRALLAREASHLPVGMEAPVVERAEPAPRAAAIYAITAPSLSPQIEEWARRDIVRSLRELSDVGSVVIEGAARQELLVQPEPRRLVVLGLAPDDLVQALRSSDQAPPRRRGRRAVTLPAGAEAIAARAVRLPDGEPIPLVEVAEVSLQSLPAMTAPKYANRPALLIYVYAQNATQSPEVADRARTQLAWLRANGQLREGVEIHNVFDEARDTRSWVRREVGLAAICLAMMLLATYVFFGRAACAATFFGLCAALPLAGGMLALTGSSLNDLTAAGILLGGVPLVLLMTRSVSRVGVLIVAVVSFLLSLIAPAYALALVAFGFAGVAAVLVGWLLASRRVDTKMIDAPVGRLFPRVWNETPRAWAVAALLVTVILVAGVIIRMLFQPSANPNARGELVVTLQGENEAQLLALAREQLPELRAIAGVEAISLSGTEQTRSQLRVDPVQLEEFSFDLVEVGRAFAIARDGLVLGELSDADARLPLRLQLAPGVSGENFERLLLRGEFKSQPAVYLRDIGSVERVSASRERIRIDSIPAMELRVRWHSAQAAKALTQWRSALTLPAGYWVEWQMQDAAPATEKLPD